MVLRKRIWKENDIYESIFKNLSAQGKSEFGVWGNDWMIKIFRCTFIYENNNSPDKDHVHYKLSSKVF